MKKAASKAAAVGGSLLQLRQQLQLLPLPPPLQRLPLRHPPFLLRHRQLRARLSPLQALQLRVLVLQRQTASELQMQLASRAWPWGGAWQLHPSRTRP